MRSSSAAIRGSRDIDRSSAEVRKRILLLFLFATCGLLALTIRLAWVQIVRGAWYSEKALEQRMRPVPVDPRRGVIFDRRGRELAVSISADSVYAVPAEVRDPVGTARKLAEVLEMDVDTLVDRLTRKQGTVWIKRKIGVEAARAVRAMALPGISVAESGQRFYPRDTLAAQVLGIAGIDNQGLEGLELFFESNLKGMRGQVIAERDAAGRQIPEGRHSYVPPTDGESIVLTIDEVIQYIAERALDRAMAETGSKQGIVLAMAPSTGEVLAMAMRPTFDPNRYMDYPASNRRNIAVCDVYEPGSTFKVITAAAAIEEGIVNANTGFYDPGFIRVGDRILRCWRPGGHGSQTFVEALENSCNPVFASLAGRLGVDKMLSYIRGFGFGSKTGIDFPGEAAGLLHPKSAIGPVELATYGFGHGISVTPLQLLNSLCAVANGGVLMKPMLVREVLDVDRNSVRKFYPTKVRQVISESTARELTRMLESVVVNGSGARAAVPGYPVAGKTGTAQKPEGGRYGDKRIASFMGYAPANDPKIAVLVIIDEPNTPIKYGGVLAAPVFQEVVRDALRYMDIPPTNPNPTGTSRTEETVQVPDVTGMARAEATGLVSKAGLTPRLEGVGATVTNQIPKPGAKVNRGTTVIVYFGHEEIYNLEDDETEVPSVTGRSLKEAAIMLGAKGLGVDPRGSGSVYKQEPAAGARVKKGTAVTIYLRD